MKGKLMLLLSGLFVGVGLPNDILAQDSVTVVTNGIPEISRSLEGRVAGVSVRNISGTFGAAPQIRIRCATSINGYSKPLWVVDGVIVNDVTEVGIDEFSSGDPKTLISSVIAGLNTDDIESVQILKDGAATAIYGARAINGVIVVTTKKGKPGKNRISYTGEYTMRMKPNYANFKLMNSQEQMGVYKEMEAKGYLNLDETFGASLQEAEYRNTDWFDALFNNNLSQNHSVSFSSGTDKATYYTSLSLMDDPGWSKQSQVKRYTANINALYHINDKLSANLVAYSSYRKQKAPGTSSQSLNPYYYALNTSRTLDKNEYYERNYAPFNILNELDNNYIDLDVVDLRFQGELKWKPLKKLEVGVLGAYKYSHSSQAHTVTESSNQAEAYRAMDAATINDNPWLFDDPDTPSSKPISVLPNGGFYQEAKFGMSSYDFRGTLNYSDVFAGDHLVNLFAGMEVNSFDRKQNWFNGVGMQYDMGYLPAFDYNYFKQLAFENEDYYSIGGTHLRESSYFGTTTYSYKGKYTLNGTMHYEGLDKVGKKNSTKWLPTWNISGAWNVDKEKFFENLKPLSYLTLRAGYSSWRTFGNIHESGLKTNSTISAQPQSADEQPENALEISDLNSYGTTNEKHHELNLGVDLGLFDGRINLSADWYKRKDYHLIGTVRTTGIGGEISLPANVDEMKSHGIELALSSQNIVTKNFKWSTDFIFADARNKVTAFGNDVSVIDLIAGSGFTAEGRPIRSLFSIDFRGLNGQGLPHFHQRNW